MTAIRPRAAYTVEDAIVRAAALVGWAALSAASGKSETALRKCADPDDEAHNLHVESALAIDAALVAAGHDPAFEELFRGRASRARSARDLAMLAAAERAAGGQVGGGSGETEPAGPERRFLAAVRESGELAEALERAASDGRLSPLERGEIVARALEAARHFRRVARSCAEPVPTPRPASPAPRSAKPTGRRIRR